MRAFYLPALVVLLFGLAGVTPLYAAPAQPRQESKMAAQTRLRPLLLRSGLGLPDEFDPRYSETDNSDIRFGRGYSGVDMRQSTGHIALVLHAFAHFPQVAAALEKGLVDTSLSPELRLARFHGQAYILTSVGQILYSGTRPDHRFGLEPGRILEKWLKDTSYEGKKLQEGLAARKAVATQYMLHLLRIMDAQSPAALEAAGMHTALWYEPPRSADSQVESSQQGGTFLQAVDQGAALLFRNHADATFMKKATALLGGSAGTWLERLNALEILAVSPRISPAQALQRSPYRRALEELDQAWEASAPGGVMLVPREALQGNLEQALLAAMSKAVPLPAALHDRSGNKSGRKGGISLQRLGNVPTAFTADAPLYLLFPQIGSREEGNYGLKQRLAEEGIPVFASSMLAGMNGPVLLPLQAEKKADALLLSWYASGGAALGKALLIASPHPPQELARRIFAQHFLVGRVTAAAADSSPAQAAASAPPAANTAASPPDVSTEGDKDILLFARPTEASFLLALLPHLEGLAGELFLQPGERLWFAVPGAQAETWYTAQSNTQTPSPASHQGKRPAKPLADDGIMPQGQGFIQLDAALTAALLREQHDAAPLATAFALVRSYPDSGKSFDEALAFYTSRMPSLRERLRVAGCPGYDAPAALAYLWLASGNDSGWEWQNISSAKDSNGTTCRKAVNQMRTSVRGKSRL